MTNDLNRHLVALTPALESGRVVPLLGAGVHFLARDPGAAWHVNAGFLPGGYELLDHFADRFEFPEGRDEGLARLAEYLEITAGRGTLYDELHQVLDADYPATAVHDLVARIPAIVREVRNVSYHQLVLTTNYDDVMERAFAAAGEQCDVVSYIADGPDRGKFMHKLFNGELRLIDNVKEYRAIDLEKRSLVVKFHGTIDRFDPTRDSYVITENDYVDYLTRAELATLLPPEVISRLYLSHFLFMGYGLRDWNLNVILHRIWGGQRIPTKSWAIFLRATTLESALWERRNVDIIDADLTIFLAALADRLNRRSSLS